MNRSCVILAVLALSLAGGCGQKAYTRSTAVTPAPVQSGPLHPANSAAMLATSPQQVRCGTQKPVWVNTHTHVYHLPGDPYYGHTKYGGYLCEQDAVRAGYRAAKERAGTRKK